MSYIKHITITLVIFLLLGGVSQAQVVLYGAANGVAGGIGPSTLFTIDPATGTGIAIGPIGFNNVSGMAYLNDGRLVASINGDELVSCNGGVCAYLIEIDLMTGSGSLIGQMGNSDDSCGRFPDLTYDPTTDTLYGYGDFCGGEPEGLFTVDTTTGTATSVGASGYTGGGNGLARHPNTGTLFGTPFDNGSLITIDPNTGAGTDVPGSLGNVPFRINALDFHPNTGILYGSHNTDSSDFFLVTIDPIGNTNTVGPAPTGLDALVFVQEMEPEPPVVEEVPSLSQWGLIAMAGILGLVGFMVIRRRATA